MARLSAHGKELARVSKEVDLKEASDSLIDWERVTYALMSDSKVLMKRDVVFRNARPISQWDSPNRDKHCYGWKVWKKVPATVTVEKFMTTFEKRGFKAEKS